MDVDAALTLDMCSLTLSDNAGADEGLHMLRTCFDVIVAHLSPLQLLRLGECCSQLHSDASENSSWHWRCVEQFGLELTRSMSNHYPYSLVQLYRKLSTLESVQWSQGSDINPGRSGHLCGFVPGTGLLVGGGVCQDVCGANYVGWAHDQIAAGALCDLQLLENVMDSANTQSMPIAPDARESICQWGGTSVVVGKKLYLNGGYQNEPLVVFDAECSAWTVPEVTGCRLPSNYEMSAVARQCLIYYFGGKPSGPEDDSEEWTASVTALDTGRLEAFEVQTFGEPPMPRHAHR